MTRRGAWLRYGLLSVLLIGIQLGTQWYFSEGVYQGDANVPLRKFPQDVDVFFVLTFTPIFMGMASLYTTMAAYPFGGGRPFWWYFVTALARPARRKRGMPEGLVPAPLAHHTEPDATKV